MRRRFNLRRMLRQRGFLLNPFVFASGIGFTPTIWTKIDASPSAGSWTLSNSDRTATESTAFVATIRSVDGKNSGKWYWEIVPSAASSFDAFIGIRSTGNPVSNGPQVGEVLSMRSNGTVYAGSSGATTGTGASFASGDVVMCAFDGTAAKFWVGVNGTWANSGNPGAGTNPLFSGFNGSATWLPSVSSDNNAADHTFAANFGQTSFAYSPPSGFNAGIGP